MGASTAITYSCSEVPEHSQYGKQITMLITRSNQIKAAIRQITLKSCPKKLRLKGQSETAHCWIDITGILGRSAL